MQIFDTHTHLNVEALQERNVKSESDLAKWKWALNGHIAGFLIKPDD